MALVFAELASHYPVAGSVYQWSKRLSHRTLGWFTGWFYFWAQVVTVSAVAVIVAFVVDALHSSLIRRGSECALPRFQLRRVHIDVHVHRHRHVDHHDPHQRVRRSPAVDPQQHRCRDRDPRDVRVSAIILLIFANVQPVSVLTKLRRSEAAQNGNIPATFALGFFMAAFVVFGFDTAGTFGEETLDAGRQAPRGVLSSILISGLVGAIFIPAVILATPDIPPR